VAAECTNDDEEVTGNFDDTVGTADGRALKGALKSAPVYSGRAFAAPAAENVSGDRGSGVEMDWRTASAITEAGTS
jgi:hypothetical protein